MKVEIISKHGDVSEKKHGGYQCIQDHQVWTCKVIAAATSIITLSLCCASTLETWIACTAKGSVQIISMNVLKATITIKQKQWKMELEFLCSQWTLYSSCNVKNIVCYFNSHCYFEVFVLFVLLMSHSLCWRWNWSH